MRDKSIKFVLPFLMAFLCFGMPVAVMASGNVDTSYVDERIVADVEAEHRILEADASGKPAVDAHGEATVGHGAVEGSHGKAKSSITPAKLKDLLWRTINFIALLIILVKFLAKPIGSALSGRQQQVIDELKDLEEKRDAAEESYKEFESRLAGMEKEMDVVVERAIAQAEAEKAKILDDAAKAADDIKRQAKAAVKAEIVEAQRTLRDDVADQAAAMAEELIVKNLTSEDQVKITEQYLDRVGAV